MPPVQEIAQGLEESLDCMISLSFLGLTFSEDDFSDLQSSTSFEDSKVQSVSLLFFRSITQDLQIMQKEWLRIQPYDCADEIATGSENPNPSKKSTFVSNTPKKWTEADIAERAAKRLSRLSDMDQQDRLTPTSTSSGTKSQTAPSKNSGSTKFGHDNNSNEDEDNSTKSKKRKRDEELIPEDVELCK
jgi:hypothetical protein